MAPGKFRYDNGNSDPRWTARPETCIVTRPLEWGNFE
jgi:hypothetical protein